MARSEFDKLNVNPLVAAGTPKVVDRFKQQTLQFAGITGGQFDVEGVVGEGNSTFVKIGATVTADGFVALSDALTLHRLRIATKVVQGGIDPPPTVWYGGVDQRSDGA